ncbi:MAG: DUF547 domain-containing protein [Myxococcaceae bacterium]
MRFRRALVAAGASLLLGTLLVAVYLFAQGYLPAHVPKEAGKFSYQPYGAALRHVDASGRIDYAALQADRTGLDSFVASLARYSPESRPDLFPGREDRLAFWVNAHNALVLQAVVDRYPDLDSPGDLLARRFYWGLSWPVGGRRLTLHAIVQRFLRLELADARTHFAVANGTSGGAALEDTPFMPDTVDAQLDDAARRFMRDGRHVRFERGAVHLSPLFEWYRRDFEGALPEGRPGGVLQIVWAFLPDTCDVRPGCETRADLDRTCGPALNKCAIVFDELDWTLNARTQRGPR